MGAELYIAGQLIELYGPTDDNVGVYRVIERDDDPQDGSRSFVGLTGRMKGVLITMSEREVELYGPMQASVCTSCGRVAFRGLHKIELEARDRYSEITCRDCAAGRKV